MHKKKDRWIFWNTLAAAMLIISIVGLYWTTELRIQQGFWSADAWIILASNIFYALLTAIFIGWVVANVIKRTNK